MLGGSVATAVPSGGVGDLHVMAKIHLFSLGGFLLGGALPFTLPTGRQDAFLGSGGLSLSPTALVELQSGRVEAHPRADGGTIFRILLKVC